MRRISPETQKRLTADDFMRQCCVCGKKPPQWHHNLIFGGSQSDEPETILPLCRPCHDKEKQPHIKEQLDWIMLNRMTEEQIQFYSKVNNLNYKRERLNAKFGSFPRKL